jgi:hypothetical protein
MADNSRLRLLFLILLNRTNPNIDIVFCRNEGMTIGATHLSGLKNGVYEDIEQLQGLCQKIKLKLTQITRT